MKKYLKLLIVMIPVAGVVVLGFNNCGRYSDLDNGSADSSSSASGGGTSSDNAGIDGSDSQSLGLPIALLSAEQTLSSMMKVTNVTAASATVMTEYNNRYGALAAGNDLNMANGPLMIGATSLAGEICNSMLTQEKAAAAANRNFFGGIDFTQGVNSVSDAGYASAIRGMARSFWGRNEEMAELTVLAQFKMDFINALAATARTQAASSSNLMLATCAAMLSSVDTLTY
jgi:hypothetical protein